tara:strand:- start:9928 stop:10416 length:489 start_codon:yes stop_codon:yes gene_type:complete
MNSIKKALFLAIVLAAGLTSSPQAFAEGDMHKGHHQEAASHDHHGESAAEHKATMGKGIIHSVDLENRKINISHQPIPALKWPEMTMDIDVAEGVDLTALAPDQAIDFHIKLGEDKVYRITKVMEPKEGHHEVKQCKAGMDCPMHKDMKHDGEHEAGHGNHH